MRNLEKEIDTIDGPLFPELPPTASLLERLKYNLWNSISLSARRGYKKMLLNLVEEDPGCSLLDLGCEDCKLTAVLAKKAKAKEVVGVDLLEDLSMTAKEIGVHKILSDLNEPFPLRGGTFNIVCASHIIEHLNNTDSFLREIELTLIPGGCLLIVTPNLASLHNIFYLLLGLQPGVASVSDELDFSEGGGPAHRRLFTPKGLVRILWHHGFTVESVVGTGYYPLPYKLAKVACLIDKHHSVNIIVKARKPGR